MKAPIRRENSACDLLTVRTLKNTDAASHCHNEQRNLPRAVQITACFKGLVQPKMKMNLCVIHPQSIGVYTFLLSDESNQLYKKLCRISRFFLTTVQKTWNKVRASIVKRASHGSGVWIKASCQKHYECQTFRKANGRLEVLKVYKSFKRAQPTLGRNDLCV